MARNNAATSLAGGFGRGLTKFLDNKMAEEMQNRSIAVQNLIARNNFEYEQTARATAAEAAQTREFGQQNFVKGAEMTNTRDQNALERKFTGEQNQLNRANQLKIAMETRPIGYDSGKLEKLPAEVQRAMSGTIAKARAGGYLTKEEMEKDANEYGLNLEDPSMKAEFDRLPKEDTGLFGLGTMAVGKNNWFRPLPWVAYPGESKPIEELTPRQNSLFLGTAGDEVSTGRRNVYRDSIGSTALGQTPGGGVDMSQMSSADLLKLRKQAAGN